MAQEALSGVRVVRAYRQEDAELERFRRSNEEYLHRNRRLIGGLGALFASRYPASSHAWLAALRDANLRLPTASGLAWTDVRGERLITSRLRSAVG